LTWDKIEDYDCAHYLSRVSIYPVY